MIRDLTTIVTFFFLFFIFSFFFFFLKRSVARVISRGTCIMQLFAASPYIWASNLRDGMEVEKFSLPVNPTAAERKRCEETPSHAVRTD